MYPEGWLIDPNDKYLLLFQRDPSSSGKRVNGFIDKWSNDNGSPGEFRNRKQASSTQAISTWIELTENGWRRVDINYQGIGKAA